MKKLAGILAVVALVMAPLAAHASTFIGRDVVSVSSQQRTEGNFYAAGGTVTISSDVSGDVAMVGGTLLTTGRISGDVAAAGGNIQIFGPVSGDVRLAGGQINVNGRIDGELVVAGGTVHILPDAVISGDVTVVGGQADIDGTVQGSVRSYGGRLAVNGTVQGSVNVRGREVVLGTDAKINGSLDYRAEKEAQFNAGQVGGKVTYTPATKIKMDAKAPAGILWTIVGAVVAIQTLAYLGMVLLVVWLWRRSALEVMQEANDRIWPAVGRGLVYLILVPIGAVILLVSFIGIIPGALLLMGYIATLIVVKVLTGIYAGSWLWAVTKKKPALQITWASAIVGTLLLEVVSLIPVIGWLVRLFLMLALLGVVGTKIQKALF